MSTERVQRAKTIQASIREVLYHDWDPISICGCGPKDEYDSYIGRIYTLLSTRPTRHAVAQELLRIERESMGYDQAKEEALLPVADKLLALDICLKT